MGATQIEKQMRSPLPVKCKCSSMLSPPSSSLQNAQRSALTTTSAVSAGSEHLNDPPMRRRSSYPREACRSFKERVCDNVLLSRYLVGPSPDGFCEGGFTGNSLYCVLPPSNQVPGLGSSVLGLMVHDTGGAVRGSCCFGSAYVRRPSYLLQLKRPHTCAETTLLPSPPYSVGSCDS